MLETQYSHGGNTIFPRWECSIPMVGIFAKIRVSLYKVLGFLSFTDIKNDKMLGCFHENM